MVRYFCKGICSPSREVLGLLSYSRATAKLDPNMKNVVFLLKSDGSGIKTYTRFIVSPSETRLWSAAMESTHLLAVDSAIHKTNSRIILYWLAACKDLKPPVLLAQPCTLQMS